MGCGASAPKENLSPDKQKLMRMVSKGESGEEQIEGNLTAAKQAGSAVSAVAEVLMPAAVAAAEKGIESLLEAAGEVPLLGGICRLLDKCWKAAKAIKKTERSVEKLMSTAAGLVEHLDKAKSALSKEDVEPLEKALTAVAEFLDQRAKAGTAMNALTRETADEKISELNKDLEGAMPKLLNKVGLAGLLQGRRVEDKVDMLREELKAKAEAEEKAKGQMKTAASDPAAAVYAYVAVQRPPVVTGHAVSLASFAKCLAGVRWALEKQESDWRGNGCFPVTLNDGGEVMCSRAFVYALLTILQSIFFSFFFLFSSSHCDRRTSLNDL